MPAGSSTGVSVAGDFQVSGRQIRGEGWIFIRFGWIFVSCSCFLRMKCSVGKRKFVYLLVKIDGEHRSGCSGILVVNY